MASKSRLRRLIKGVSQFYAVTTSLFCPLLWLYTHANEWHLLRGNWQHLIISIFSYLGDVLMQAFDVLFKAVLSSRMALLILFGVLLLLGIYQYLNDDYEEKGTQTRKKQVARIWTGIIGICGYCSVLTICLVKGLTIASTASSRERPYGLGGSGLPYMPLLSPHRYYQVCTVLGGVFATVAYIMAALLVRAAILDFKEMYYDEPDKSE